MQILRNFELWVVAAGVLSAGLAVLTPRWKHDGRDRRRCRRNHGRVQSRARGPAVTLQVKTARA